MQVDGEVIEAGSRVRLTEKAVSKVKGSNAVSLRQQFCRDDTTGTIRSVLRYYCIDIDQGISDISVSFLWYQSAISKVCFHCSHM